MNTGEDQNKNEKMDETLMGMKVLKPKENTIEEETKTDETKVVEKVVESKTEIELNDDQVANYLKTKYKDRQFEKLEDLFKAPTEKVVEKNPFEDVIDEEDKAYYNYKRETGRSRKEFEYLKENISEKDALELSIDRLRQDTGLKLSKEEAISYLEEELNIDLTDEDAATKNKIALNKYAKPRREELIAQQEKYRTPLETKLAEESAKKKQVEMVKLENGKEMPKAEYDALVQQRNEYVENIKKAVSSAASFDVKTTIDDNGVKKELKYTYDRNEEDKHSMLSNVADIDSFIDKTFNKKDGFDYKGLAELIDRGYNFEKYLGLAMQQIRAEVMEEMISNSNNENFSTRRIPERQKTVKEGYKSIEQVLTGR